MFNDLLGKLTGCSCVSKNTSCDVLWIIVLLLIVFKGGAFGLDICTLVILFIVFGKDLLGGIHKHKCC